MPIMLWDVCIFDKMCGDNRNADMKALANSNPEVVVWVVDATSADSGERSSQELASSLSNASLQPKEKLLILINKMCVSLAKSIESR